MKLYIIAFLIFYAVCILFRFVTATSDDGRLETRFKVYNLNKAASILLFLSVSKKPVAVHCIIIQIVNIISLIVSLFGFLQIRTVLLVYVHFLFVFWLIPLFIELIVNEIKKKNKQ